MIKKIESIFNYTDYRVVLQDDFTARSSSNHSYSLRAYARDLNISPGFLSSVMRGKKHFTRKSCKEVFLKLGFKKIEEQEYIENLLDFNSSKDAITRQDALAFIKKNYSSLNLKDKSSRDGILQTYRHFLIYMIIEKEYNYNKIINYTNELGIDKKTTDKIIKSLVKDNYLEWDEFQVRPLEKKIALTSSNKILDCCTDVSKFLFSVLKKKRGISFPERSTHCLVMGFDQESLNQAVEVYKQFLHQIYRISNNTQKVDRITFFCDSLVSIYPDKSLIENS